MRRSASSRPTRRRRVWLAAALIAAVAAMLAACGTTAEPKAAPAPSTSTSSAPSTPASTQATSASATSAFPVIVTNCGEKVTVDGPPQRIVAIKSTSLELLLALGVGDRVVGKAFLDGPVPEQWAGAADAIPLISDQAPSQEPVLELNPDFIFAGWESNFSADTAGTRSALAAKHINTYVSPDACEGKYQPAKLTFPMLFDEFAELGRILGVPDAARSLISEQSKQLAAASHTPDGTTALWWSSGGATPYVGAGIGEPQMVMDAVGLTNIMAKIPQTWSSVGWESIVAANPDVIILVDASWSSAAKKIKNLESNPATARLDAVKNRRFITIPFPAAEAGVRSVQAVVDIDQQLKDLGVTH